MTTPIPTPIYRFIHINNLAIYLRRGGLHSPNHTPANGMTYKTIHNVDIQHHRGISCIRCGPEGVIHDYVPFYFGPRSPMLYRLHTKWETDYNEGQQPLIYLVSTVQTVHEAAMDYVFSDGHGIAQFTQWFDNPSDLDKVDWVTVYARYWKDDIEDMDRQRRKQAEFLIHGFCPWSLIMEIGTLNHKIKHAVEEIMGKFPQKLRRPVRIKREWYY